MLRELFAAAIVGVFVSGITAQEPPVAATAPAPITSRQDVDDQGQDPGPQYLIEMKLLESEAALVAGEGKDSMILSADAKPTSTPQARDVVLSEPSETKSEQSPETVEFKPNPDIWDPGYRHAAGVTILATPKMVVLAKTVSSIEMTSKQSFTFLQPDGQGKFESRQTELHQLGVWINLSVEPVAGDDQDVRVPALEVQVAALDGREPVVGLEDLEVGEPVIGKRSLKTSVKFRLGETRSISLPTGPNRHALLAMRIKKLEATPHVSSPLRD